MSFKLDQFMDYMTQVKDKDWLDEHLIICLVKDTDNKLKDKIRDKLEKDESKRSKT